VTSSELKEEREFKGQVEASGVRVKWLIDEGVGARNFALRLFTITPNGYIAPHTHPWEHEIYVLRGGMLVRAGGGEASLKPGDALFIPSGETHEFRNHGAEPCVFLCAISGTHREPP